MSRPSASTAARAFGPGRVQTSFGPYCACSSCLVMVQSPRLILLCGRRGMFKGMRLILHNRSLSGTASGRVALTGTPRHAALYDPAGGGYRPVGHRVADGRLVIDVVLPPYALWCVRLSDELPPLQKVDRK